MHRNLILIFIALLLTGLGPQNSYAQQSELINDGYPMTGAAQFDKYLPMLEGKNVGLLINQTSEVNITSLLDTLLSKKVNVKKVFVPEHGFRGQAEAGEKVDDEKDKKTGLPIISLYGNNKKPTKSQLKNIDVLIYDLQDVGVRFYTYISTLQYAMEACAEYGVKLIVLDRPNPNGHYVDGPVLDTQYRSFVGMQPVPIVYGMTAGEYAKMLVGEKWFPHAEKLDMTVIPCLNYDHLILYPLPVPPSPNLRNMTAVYCYPTICLFEGTLASVGRGTDKPFQQWGAPVFRGHTFYFFTPKGEAGKPQPLYAFRECFGLAIAATNQEALGVLNGRVRVTWLIKAYGWMPKEEKGKFFNDFFTNLAGTKELRKQIEEGKNEGEIQASWKPGIEQFKKIRKKYLLYKDFE